MERRRLQIPSGMQDTLPGECAGKRRLEVFYDRNYRSLLDMQSFGHDIEASWLIWDAAETLLPESNRAPYLHLSLIHI